MEEDDEEKSPHWMVDILTYPFRGSGKYLLVLIVILSVGADLASAAPLLGLLASVLSGGYFCAIYFNLVESSLNGDEEAPTFPDISNLMEDIFWPLIQMLAALLVSFLPWLIFLFVVGPDPDTFASDWRFWAFVALGLVYFPMALLCTIVLGTLGALSPHIVIPAIFRAMPHYLGALVMLAGILALQVFLDSILPHTGIGPQLAGYALQTLIGAWALMTNARILGLVYHHREEQMQLV